MKNIDSHFQSAELMPEVSALGDRAVCSVFESSLSNLNEVIYCGREAVFFTEECSLCELHLEGVSAGGEVTVMLPSQGFCKEVSGAQ